MAIQTRIDERTVVGLWERQAFEPSGLDALGLRVIFRGLPSDAGGPDYQDAILSVGGKRLLTGDVEFHVRTSDWYGHGHHLNSKYNRVILHVAWSDDTTETMREDGVSIPTLALERCALPPSMLDVPSMRRLVPHPCIATFASLPSDRLLQEVHRLGVRRFEERASRFATDLECEDPDQVAYRALLEGLGYASNRLAFAHLADAVPYAWLQSIPVAEQTATLLDAAGLGPSAPLRPPAHLPAGSWRLTRLRPANHPARRIQGMALLLARMAPSLAGSWEEAVARADRPSDLRTCLVAREGGAAGIGPGRADELAASVVLPLVAALNPSDEAAARLFASYPSPPPNRWTRHMLSLMQEAGHDVPRCRTAPEHQGLHYLYHAFCREGRVADCTLCQMACGRG